MDAAHWLGFRFDELVRFFSRWLGKPPELSPPSITVIASCQNYRDEVADRKTPPKRVYPYCRNHCIGDTKATRNKCKKHDDQRRYCSAVGTRYRREHEHHASQDKTPAGKQVDVSG